MKKFYPNSKLIIFFLMVMFFLLPSTITKSETQTIAPNTQIGSYNTDDTNDPNRRLIFYATLKPSGATPYAIGNNFTPITFKLDTLRYDPLTSLIDYSYFLNGFSPNLYLLVDTEDNDIYTGAEAERINLYSTPAQLEAYTQQSARYRFDSTSVSDKNINITSEFSLVEGASGLKNVLRYDYSVTNLEAYPLYIGGKNYLETEIGKDKNKDSLEATMKPVILLDQPEKYNFFPITGLLSYFISFSTQNGGTVPSTWYHLLKFHQSNPVTCYWNVVPDKKSTSIHLYPPLDYLEFRQRTGMSITTNGNDSWVPKDQQFSKNQGALFNFLLTTMQWNKTKVEPGQTIHFVYFIGDGDLNIVEADNLNYLISYLPNKKFSFGESPVGSNGFDPIQLSLRIDNKVAIKNLKVKMFYDEKYVQPLDASYQSLSAVGTANATINGITKEYPYVLVDVGDISTVTTKYTSFYVSGENNTYHPLETYLQFEMSYENNTGQNFTNISSDYDLIIPNTLESDFDTGYIKVIHEDITDGDHPEILYEEIIAGNIDEKHTIYSLNFSGFTLLENQANHQDLSFLKLEDATFSPYVYKYKKQAQSYAIGNVIIQHQTLDENGVEIMLATELVHGAIGSNITLIPKNWPGYKSLSETPQSVTFQDEIQIIVFYYTLEDTENNRNVDIQQHKGTLFVEHVDEKTGNILAQDIIVVEMDSENDEKSVPVNAIMIQGYSLNDNVEKTVNITGGLTTTISFRYLQQGYVCVQHIDEANNEMLFEEYQKGTAGEIATVSAKDFTSYSLAPNEININNQQIFMPYTIDEAPTTIPIVVFKYEKNETTPTGDILVQHIVKKNDIYEQSSIQTLAVEHVHGSIGTSYIAYPKTFYGYEEQTATKTEIFSDQPKIIVFEYEKKLDVKNDFFDAKKAHGFLIVEHLDQKNLTLIARDTLLIPIEKGETQTTFTIDAIPFYGYTSIDGLSKTITINNGQTMLTSFLYQKIEQEKQLYQLKFLDEVSGDVLEYTSEVLGIPGTLVDFGLIQIPAGFMLSAEYVDVVFPEYENELTIVVKPNTTPQKMDLLIRFIDIRNVPIPHLVDYLYEKSEPQNKTLPLNNTQEIEFSIPTFAQGAPRYHILISDYFFGTEIDLTQYLPDNYLLNNDVTGNFITSDSALEDNYIFESIYVKPKQIQVVLKINNHTDPNGEIQFSFPWNTALTTDYINQELSKHAQYQDYLLNNIEGLHYIVINEHTPFYNISNNQYEFMVYGQMKYNTENDNDTNRKDPPNAEEKPAEDTRNNTKQQNNYNEDDRLQNKSHTEVENSKAEDKKNFKENTEQGTEKSIHKNLPDKIEPYTSDQILPTEKKYYKPYLFGYDDHTIRASASLTRAQLAQMLYCIYGDILPTISVNQESPFSDVDEKDWYANAIKFVVSYNLLSGYSNHLFRPNESITRAEFLTMVCPYETTNSTKQSLIFYDVQEHWARNVIEQSYMNKVIQGYEDGSFRPDQFITRAEAVVILNKLLHRPNEWIKSATFTDLQNESYWAYKALMNASNTSY